MLIAQMQPADAVTVGLVIAVLLGLLMGAGAVVKLLVDWKTLRAPPPPPPVAESDKVVTQRELAVLWTKLREVVGNMDKLDTYVHSSTHALRDTLQAMQLKAAELPGLLREEISKAVNPLAEKVADSGRAMAAVEVMLQTLARHVHNCPHNAAGARDRDDVDAPALREAKP